MYSSLQLAGKYFNYLIKAKNGKGHGIHSPFVFDFIKNVLNDKKKYECYAHIESLRKKLLKDDSIIEVEDFGAGSAVIPFKKRKINAIAASSLKNKKFAQLLFRIVKYYKPATVVELGTSFGITTCYLACANEHATVFTLEGSKSIAAIASKNFSSINQRNIQLEQGDFAQSFPAMLQKINSIDLLFVDGNHRKETTLFYFEECLKRSASSSIFIFDDIHWSAEMVEAWELIKQHAAVTLTIDLFFIGLVFFNTDFKVKQDFVIRF